MKKRKDSFRPRRRYRPEERQQLVAEYEQSELTQEAFAKERGINVGTFRQWLYRKDRLGPTHEREPVFEELSLRELPFSDAWAAEISWPQGPTIRLSAKAAPTWAGELIKNLGRSC